MAQRNSFFKDPFPKKEVFVKTSKAPTKAVKVAKSKKAVVPVEKLRVQVWTVNEYGDGNIIASGSDLNAAFKKAVAYVNEHNMDNALASGDRDANWEVYFPQVFKGAKLDPKVIYGGNRKDGTHQVYTQDKDGWRIKELEKGDSLKIFLGDTLLKGVKKPWFLKDRNQKEVTSLSSPLLEQKTVLFFKIL